MQATTELADIYLVEKSGDRLSIFGPYTPGMAKHEAGKIYSRMRGNALADRSWIYRGVLQDLVSLGSVWYAD